MNLRRKLLVSALLLVIAVDVMVLAGVASNRAGSPTATLRLTERELPLQWMGIRSRENSGVAVTLEYDHGELAWFDDAKLRALGFATTPHTAEPDDGKKQLARKVYVALEFDGPAWAELLRREEAEFRAIPQEIEAGTKTQADLERARKELDRMRVARSRLVPVDADLDPAALRARHPNPARYLITAAEVRVNRYYAPKPTDKPSPHGYIVRILTNPIHVPARLHEALARATRETNGTSPNSYWNRSDPPRYELEVRYGSRYEPWIESVQPLSGARP